jgi:6-phospho-3-hexuloisomerase
MRIILDEMNSMADSLNEDHINLYIEKLTELILSANKNNLNFIGLGAGRMGYSLRAFIMRLSHMGYSASFIGDTNVPRVTSNTILFVNSSSGETPSIALYVKQAKEAQGHIFTTTCNMKSTISLNSNYIIQLPTIESDQLMKSAYEQFTMLLYDYIVSRLMLSLKLDPNFVTKNHSILE